MSGSSYPIRQHHRLSDYDYASPGYYFITICTRNNLPLFGTVVEGCMNCTPAGAMVQDVWDALPRHYVGIDVDAFIAMPTHVHGIIILEDNPARTLSLPDVVHQTSSELGGRGEVCGPPLQVADDRPTSPWGPRPGLASVPPHPLAG
jgi:REP element-mobilizing transposase RayT